MGCSLIYQLEIWDMLENDHLFNTKGGPENEQKNTYHLAHMIALLGHPLKDLLERCKRDWVLQYFEENGERYVFYLLPG